MNYNCIARARGGYALPLIVVRNKYYAWYALCVLQFNAIIFLLLNHCWSEKYERGTWHWRANIARAGNMGIFEDYGE
tara:strand:- start:36 stop:266 length:231 start_codon:yes stop_codon:yes gene_type:complete